MSVWKVLLSVDELDQWGHCFLAPGCQYHLVSVSAAELPHCFACKCKNRRNIEMNDDSYYLFPAVKALRIQTLI